LDGNTIVGGINRARVFIHETVAKGVIKTIGVQGARKVVSIDDRLDNWVIHALEIMNNIRYYINLWVCVREVEGEVIPGCC
jgi:hypothetical protein